VARVDNPVYAEECGACHLAYPPGLLPGRSWAKLMEAQALEDHFGDDATLDEATRTALAAYLAGASADESWRKRAIKVRQSIPDGEAPLRISEVPYIKRAHRELDAEAVKANDNIKSFAQCNRCHRRAERGVFDDDTVKIPEPSAPSAAPAP
ncbi:MAG: diheme cytochrome c, partial [Deltaproteobacteria bacterium]|nr:diheme cytochrome c [Deltaproteobacteria bacterium]